MSDQPKEKQPSFLAPQPKRRVWDVKERVLFPELFRSTDSIQPSYTKFVLPYDAVCRQRYHAMKKEHRRQLCAELRLMELHQTSALDGVRLHLAFCNCFQEVHKRVPQALNSRQRMRLEDLLKQRKGFFY